MGIDQLLEELKSKGVLFDTNTLIYYFDDIKPYSNVLESIISYVNTGEIQAYISVVTVAELLVKPIREKKQDVIDQYLTFFRLLPNLTLVEITQEIAIRTARIRASVGLKMPDALIVGTAADKKCVILGNDSVWATKNLPVTYYLLKQLNLVL